MSDESAAPYKLPVAELVDRFQELYTAAINDMFQRRGLHDQWLGPSIKCRTREMGGEVVAGPAFTVQWVSDPAEDQRQSPAAHMVGSYPEHGIIVVDTGQDQVSGFWGELATTVCLERGVNGAIINGGAKDTGFVHMVDFPIFARFTSPVDGFYRSRLHAWQVPIWFDGVRIEPNDFIVADRDGAVVVPQGIAEDILVEAEGYAEEESHTRRLLREGVPAAEATRLTGRRDL